MELFEKLYEHALHGSRSLFSKFDLSYNKSSSNQNYYGYGVYLTSSDRIAREYTKVHATKDAPSYLYEVEVAHDFDSIFVWNQLLKDQPLLLPKFEDMMEGEGDKFQRAVLRDKHRNPEELENLTGRRIYKNVAHYIDKLQGTYKDSYKQTSELFRKYGIEGHKYKGGRFRHIEDVWHYVIFNDKDIKIKKVIDKNGTEDDPDSGIPTGVLNPHIPMKAGVVIFNNGKVLGCHATGNPSDRFDLPKGTMDDGEDPKVAAVRELREETGIELATGDVYDLGKFPFKNGNIWLYLYDKPIDISTLHCDSLIDNVYYPERNGLPECDGFKWLEPDGSGRNKLYKTVRFITAQIYKDYEVGKYDI
jgi:8-oxo-dGTP pyrophosphatase MutT (NUDIX family)